MEQDEKWRKGFSPVQILAISFLAAIVIGTFLLSLPISTRGERLFVVDALFTATSATCVTGLIVVDTGSKFTPFGQAIILLLIQAGGLGIMTFSSLFTIMLGKRIRIRDQMVIAESLSPLTIGGIGSLLKYTLIFTFICEAIGVFLLYPIFCKEFSPLVAGYYALFHSVSAFCNAGFSLFETSFIKHQGNLGLNLIIITLIILGGIGFMVVTDLISAFWKRRVDKARRVSLHTKLVLAVSTILIGVATLIIFIFENGNTMKGMPLLTKFLCTFFHAVTPRTAGFNTLDVGRFASTTLFLTIILMFIGGSPGSTAGGIKTSTLGVVFGTVRSMLWNRKEIELFGRSIPRDVAHRALSIITLSSLLVILSSILLLMTEGEKDFLRILFEVVSAFGTVGLSAGITPSLSLLGKLVIILTMFTGRIGPLTLAFIVGQRKPTSYKYPEEKVMVG